MLGKQSVFSIVGQAAKEKLQKKKFSSYRVCMSLDDAVKQGYVEGR